MRNFWAIRISSIVAAVFGVFLLSQIAEGMTNFHVRLVLLAGLYVTLAVSLNLINGITGQFSLGHIAFYAVGAYTAMVNGAYLLGKSAALPPVAVVLSSVVLGAAMAAVAGLIVGLPSLRLKGDYLAIVTLGAGEIVRIIVQNAGPLGKSAGADVLPKMTLVWLAIGLAVVTVAACRNLQVSTRGLNFLAVREDEVAASAMGVNVTRVKVAAFVIGSAFAGAAGAVYGHYEGFLSPALFTMDYSILIVTMVVLGGTGSITGSVIAALVLFLIPEFMRDYKGTSVGNVLSFLVALVVVVALIRRLYETYHGGKRTRTALALATIIGGLMIAAVVGAALRTMPYFATTVEGNKLRQVVPAITLVVMMLLRPQGLFGHKEFTLRNLLGRRREEALA